MPALWEHNKFSKHSSSIGSCNTSRTFLLIVVQSISTGSCDISHTFLLIAVQSFGVSYFAKQYEPASLHIRSYKMYRRCSANQRSLLYMRINLCNNPVFREQKKNSSSRGTKTGDGALLSGWTSTIWQLLLSWPPSSSQQDGIVELNAEQPWDETSCLSLVQALPRFSWAKVLLMGKFLYDVLVNVREHLWLPIINILVSISTKMMHAS